MSMAMNAGVRPCGQALAAGRCLPCAPMLHTSPIRSGHPATLSKAEHPGRRGLTAARALPPLMQLPASLAEEVADPVTGGKLADLGQLTSGINPTQIILLLSPLLLYGTFYLYREKFDRKAKISDFLFIIAASAIAWNIISILVLKVRLF
ncbi:hypothetical protein ACKKBG_A32205 [Auxenochlorella protothecoides x Auxenochlorella symbiontica]